MKPNFPERLDIAQNFSVDSEIHDKINLQKCVFLVLNFFPR